MIKDGISGRIFSLAEQSLDEWESGRRSLDAIIDYLRREAPDERPAVASLLFAYFRRKSFIDSLIDAHASRGKVKPQLKRILAAAATQALTQSGIAPESAVNVAVDYTTDFYGSGSASFVNAMLRSILREHPYVPEWSGLPERLANRWRKNFGAEKSKAAIASLARNPPLPLRIRGIVDEALLESLHCSKPNLPEWTSKFDFRECSAPEELFKSGLVDQGLVYVQDPATAFAVSLAEGRIKGRIIDICAAPGGKTIMLADRAEEGSTIFASDRSISRLAMASENFHRAGREIFAVAADAVAPPFPEQSFDLVFADVPCSNTGVSRRRPDAPWRFSITSMDKLTGLQTRIMDAASKLVVLGGAMIFSTCSVEPEEGKLQIEKFLSRHPEFRLENSGLTLPSESHDGAFAALLIRI